MNYFNLKFRVDFLGKSVKNVIINILFFTVYEHEIYIYIL